MPGTPPVIAVDGLSPATEFCVIFKSEDNVGLKVNTISEIPDHVAVGFYLYLLDYGWDEPLGETLRKNFDKIAGFTSRNDAAVVMGFGSEFNDSVLSWHGFNGQDADDLLPALLISNKPPTFFYGHRGDWNENIDNLILIPFRRCCSKATEVISLINRVLQDIRAGKELSEFKVAKEQKAGQSGALIDALILQPNFSGIGLDLKKVFAWFRKGS